MKTVRIVIQRLIVFATMTLGASLVSQLSWAGTQLWNFEKDTKDWKVANGDWKVEGGVYKETSGAVPAMHTLVGDEKWDDYTLEAKIRIDQGNWAGLVFRAQSEFEYYVYYLNIPNNKSEVWRHKKGAFDARDAITSNIPAAGKLQIKNNEWYDVKVVVEGNLFKLFINGEAQSEQKDGVGAPYQTGKIGVWAWQSKASFDDVKVTGKNIKDTLAVEPRNKLAITWGKLKQMN